MLKIINLIKNYIVLMTNIILSYINQSTFTKF